MIKQYDTLYSRDSTGNIRVWYMTQNNDTYTTTSGVLNGQLTISKPTLAIKKNVGKKNELSAVKQATEEINAKYKKQLKTGYHINVADIDHSHFVEPMLAKKLNDRLDKLTFPAMLDRKYNGGRVVITKHGAFSRTGEKWNTIPHIVNSLQPLFDLYPDLVIDGEGYNHEYRHNLNDLMSILNTRVHITEDTLRESEKAIKYYVYDCYGFDNVTPATGCEDRRKAAKKLFARIKYIVVVDYEIVNTLDEIYNHYQSYVDDGYEGVMYRTLNAPYQNSRSSHLLKLKPEDSSEAIVLAVLEGTGNWAGVAKTARLNWRGLVFDATFKGKHEQLKQILHDPKQFINKEVTFLYNGLTGLKTPNFARIDINNCFKK